MQYDDGYRYVLHCKHTGDILIAYFWIYNNISVIVRTMLLHRTATNWYFLKPTFWLVLKLNILVRLFKYQIIVKDCGWVKINCFACLELLANFASLSPYKQDKKFHSTPFLKCRTTLERTWIFISQENGNHWFWPLSSTTTVCRD